jgi:hypothetical protein
VGLGAYLKNREPLYSMNLSLNKQSSIVHIADDCDRGAYANCFSLGGHA